MHHCEGALITCEDFRLHQRKDGCNYVADFIKNLGVDCDLITRGGGVQDIVRPPKEGFRESVLRDENVSDKIHNAGMIILLNHEDCGAYAKFNFPSRKKEFNQHYSDLHEAKSILLENFPGKQIKLFFAELKSGTNDVFAIKEVL